MFRQNHVKAWPLKNVRLVLLNLLFLRTILYKLLFTQNLRAA